MLSSFYAIYKNGHIEFPINEHIPDGTTLLVTVLSDSVNVEFQKMSEKVLDKIWNNEEDDVYEQLLQK